MSDVYEGRGLGAKETPANPRMDGVHWEAIRGDEQPEELLRWAVNSFGPDRVVLLSSFQAEESVLIDLAARAGCPLRIVTIDTGRLPEETYAMIDRIRDHYRIPVEVIYPQARLVEAMTTAYGVNLFYREAGLRRLCCHVRKVLPLARALEGVKAWVTGLRREQSPSRAAVAKVAPDPDRPGVVKLAPLADWTAEEVWRYIRRYGVPYHPLYDAGYTSIGCAPCTRPVEPGEHPRSGRWWWETDGLKECGLHAPDGAAHSLPTLSDRNLTGWHDRETPSFDQANRNSTPDS